MLIDIKIKFVVLKYHFTFSLDNINSYFGYCLALNKKTLLYKSSWYLNEYDHHLAWVLNAYDLNPINDEEIPF